MSLPPRNFEEWMKQVNRTLTEVKRNSQASVSDQIGREVGKIEDQIKDIGDPRTPAAPVEVVVTSSVLPDSSKVNRGYITMTFPAVDVATDASPLDVASYEMYGRRVDNWDGQGDGPTFSLMASAFQPALTSDMVVPGSTYEVRARAIGETTTRPGLLSEVKSIVVIRDLIPPPIPSPLALSQNLSVVKGAWDGLDATGAPMPPDFAYTEPRIQLPSGYVSIEDYLTQAGNFLDTTAPYDIEVNYSHRAVDTSGNKSGWSIGMPITVKSLVDEGAIRDALDAAKEAIDAVSAELVTVGAELTTRLETAEADLLASNERLTANEGAIGTLTNTTIPALNTQIANAKNDITAAFGQISTVSGTATAALNAATHTGKNLFSTRVASGSAPYGSIWTQTDSNGKALSSWQQTGGSAPHPTTGLGGVDGSTWTARPIRSEMIDNLDVGKLVTNTAEINNAVIGKMAVGIATVIELNAERITAGTINTARLNVQQIAAGTAAFQTVDVKNIFAGTGTFQTAVIDKLWADVISARKITSDMVLVGSGFNMIPWYPQDTSEPHSGWNGTTLVRSNDSDYGWLLQTNMLTMTSGVFTIFMQIKSGEKGANGLDGAFSVTEGESYRIKIGGSLGGSYPSGSPNVRIYTQVSDAAGAMISQPVSDAVAMPYSGPAKFAEVLVKIPVGGRALKIYMQQDQPGLVMVHSPSMTVAADASLIVEGGILAQHVTASESMTAKIAKFLKINAGMIEANAITADKIKAGAITSVKIDTEAVTADKIKVNSITATQIATDAITASELAADSVLAVNIATGALDAKMITGPTVRTQASPSTKGGYQLDNYGFRIWSNTGVRTVDMNGTTGAVKIIGSLTSGKVGTASVVIDDSLWDLGFAGIHIEAYKNKVAGIKMATTGTSVGSLYLTSANNSTADIGTAKTRSQIRLQPTEFDMQATNSAGAVTSWVNGDATLLSLKSFAGKVDLHGVKGVTISAASGSDVDINAHGTASWYLSLRKDATSEFILSNAIYARRYTGSYPVVITGNGVLGCNVSSAKYKLAVQPIEEDYDDRLLSIRAVTWFDRTESEAVADFYDHMERGVPFIDENGNEVTETPTALRRIPGVIAEEVDAAGLKEFVNYENDGDVMGVMYDRFGVALIPVVRRQRDRIIELENDRDSMREALAALLSRVALLENAN